MDGREALLERFIYVLEGSATEGYVAMIKRVIVKNHSGHSN
tara:strand:+ start:298 stop:420 length:123 start_codon:yes stop_codon:yes gene_type:complete